MLATLDFGPYSAFVYIILGLGMVIFVVMYVIKTGALDFEFLHRMKKNADGVPFGFDLTKKAAEGQIDAVVGRSDEIDRVIHILSRRTKNNPLLIGPAGVGKTAIVEGLALKIATNDIPTNLSGKKIWVLNIADLLSGTKYRGEFEKRAQTLISEIQAANRSIILFIDEIHTLVQTKGTEGAVNFTDVLKPALARGDLQLIGATTIKEFEEFIKPDETLERRFQLVTVDEPTVEEAIEILKGVKMNYEEYHNVEITDESIQAAVRLSHEYITNRRLPDKAIDLIDEASATVNVREHAAPESAVALLHHASYKARCEFDECPIELMKMKDELATIKQQETEHLTLPERERLRKKEIELVSEIQAIERTLTKKEGRPKVTPQEIKKIVSLWVGIPVGNLH